jgi:hypothetical protein
VVTTSALGVRVVVTVASGSVPLLFSGKGSGVAEVFLAVFLTVPDADAGAMKLTVLMAGGAPEGKLGIAGKVTIPVSGL